MSTNLQRKDHDSGNAHIATCLQKQSVPLIGIVISMLVVTSFLLIRTSRVFEFSAERARGTCNLRWRMKYDPAFIESVTWAQHGAHVRINITGCSLQMSHSQARSCIVKAAPHGLLLIGDSLTRYQYLNLAYFLATGDWQSPAPQNSNEKLFGSWNAFYNLTNSRLGGRELCDCFRHEHSFADISESRFFRDGALAVTYVQMFAPPAIKIHHTDYIRQHSPLCPPNSTYLINFNANESPERLVALARSHSLTLINMGHWYRGNVTGHMSTRLRDMLSREKSVHWKTTTFPGGRDSRLASRFNHVYDAHSLTSAIPKHFVRSLMWDYLHFQEDVYHGLNQVLLAYLCEGEKRDNIHRT